MFHFQLYFKLAQPSDENAGRGLGARRGRGFFLLVGRRLAPLLRREEATILVQELLDALLLGLQRRRDLGNGLANLKVASGMNG
jgi:hypothetical protein